MPSDRINAKIVGVLFIVATAAAALSQVFIGSSLDDTDYLTTLAGEESRMRIGVLLDLLTAASVVGIPVMLYQVLKRHGELISVGYLVARMLEAVVIVVGAVGLLTLLALSKDFVAGAPSDASAFETLGSVLLQTRDVTDALGTQLIFSVTALILNYSLYRSRLVPRFISTWGLLGAPLMFLAGLLGMFGRDPFSTLLVSLAAPLAVNEMVLAAWLILKGYASPAPGADEAGRGGSAAVASHV